LLSALREQRGIDARAAFVIIGRARSFERRRGPLRPIPPRLRGLTLPVPTTPVQDETPGETPGARWQRLMVGAQAGDQRAYAAFLKEAAVFVRVIARRYHRDAGAVEDVAQETLLSLHRIRHTYEPGRPVEPWVAAIAKARAIDALRAHKRRRAVETDVADDTIADAQNKSPAHRVEAASEVAAALAALPPGQRAAVRMLKIEEMSLAEAAEASGQSVPALKSLLHRAMLTLRAGLKGQRDA